MNYVQNEYHFELSASHLHTFEEKYIAFIFVIAGHNAMDVGADFDDTDRSLYAL
jgi:hypothetical protein